MRHSCCAFLYLFFLAFFDSKFALADISISDALLQKNSYLLQSNLNGEATQVRLDNFISVSNSNPQQNKDLFFAVESVREFEFNAIDSSWNGGARYSGLEGFQLWVKEFKSEYHVDLLNLKTKMRFKLGRFYYTNLKLDSVWGLGVVEPEFRGDPLSPQHQGLTGFSFLMDLGKLQFSLFASPISFPDTGVAYNIQDGQVVSESPWFTEAPTSVMYQGQPVNLSYNLNIRDRFNLLANPSLIAGIKTQIYGLGFSLNGGILPSNQFFLEVDPKARVNDNNQSFVEANVVPSLVPKAILALKLDKDFKNLNVWGEYFSESHQGDLNTSNANLYESEIYDHSFITLGMDSKIKYKSIDLDLGFSFLRNTSQTQLNILNDFPFSNYIFNNAFETRLAFLFYPSQFGFNFNFKYDFDGKAFLASPRLTYRTKDRVQLYSQYDLIGRSSENDVNGFLAQQAANDRFTVGLSYVF